MSETIGDTPFEAVLGQGRSDIEQKAKTHIQNWLDYYGFGVTITQVIILDALPVANVIPAFNEVNKAAQDMERIIYQAEIDYLNVIPEAYGQAKRVIADAEAYKLMLLNQAQGEATRFTLTLEEYKKAPQITADKLYFEAMDSLLAQTPNMILAKQLSGILPVFMGGLNSIGGKITPPAQPTKPSAAPKPVNKSPVPPPSKLS